MTRSLLLAALAARSLLAALALLSLLAVPALHAQSFEILPTLPAAGLYPANAVDVSDNGQVVVGYSYNGSRYEAVRWTGTDIQGLGYIPGDRPESHGLGVSGDGTLVAGYLSYFFPAQTPIKQAVRWVGTTMLPMGYLSTVALSSAQAASQDGSVIVGWSNTSNNRIEAFRWENGQMAGIGYLNGGPALSVSRALDVSADGSVVVGTALNANNKYEAFRWENGQMTGLGFHDPTQAGRESSALSVSADGRVVVGVSQVLEGAPQAFRWENGQMMAIPLPDGCIDSGATGVSGDGSIVVGYQRCASGKGPFIWTESGGTRYLRDVLEGDFGLDLMGWRLSNAASITPDGRVIVGDAQLPPNTGMRPFRAVLGESPGLVVTVTGDEPNDPASASEDRCDVDHTEPEDQCTLRAAIEAGERPGRCHHHVRHPRRRRPVHRRPSGDRGRCAATLYLTHRPRRHHAAWRLGRTRRAGAGGRQPLDCRHLGRDRGERIRNPRPRRARVQVGGA